MNDFVNKLESLIYGSLPSLVASVSPETMYTITYNYEKFILDSKSVMTPDYADSTGKSVSWFAMVYLMYVPLNAVN